MYKQSFKCWSFLSLTAIVALRIVRERPNYELFENNCQNFVTFLLNVLCPGVLIPETIQCVLERLRDIVTLTTNNKTSLPGAYPLSNISISFNSSVTSSAESWFSASGETWITAIEYMPPGRPTSLEKRESRTMKTLKTTREPTLRRKLVAVGDYQSGKTALLTYVLPNIIHYINPYPVESSNWDITRYRVQVRS